MFKCRKVENIIWEENKVESECNYQHLECHYFKQTLIFQYIFFFIYNLKHRIQHIVTANGAT